MRSLVSLVAVCSAVGLLVSGCTFASMDHRATVTPRPSPTSRSEQVVAIPNGLVASGDIRSPDRGTTGHFEITDHSGTFSIALTRFHSPFPIALESLSDQDVALGSCADGRVEEADIIRQLRSRATAQSADLPNPDGAWDDPSFFRTFVISAYEKSAPSAACGLTVIATSRIAWRIPITHPDLAVTDSGVADFAWGSVTSKDGHPWTYLTHQGDNWESIAKRFGITPADLTFLNPIRLEENKPDTAYIGQPLNLSVDNRGNSNTRRLIASQQ